MAYKVIILYQLYMPSYFLGTFTEYPSSDTTGRTFGKPNRILVPAPMVFRHKSLHLLFVLQFKGRRRKRNQKTSVS